MASSSITQALNVPIYQIGVRNPYNSVETKPFKGVDGSLMGKYSLTLPARIEIDAQPQKISPWLDKVREIGLKSILDLMSKAGQLFRYGTLETGGLVLDPQEYCRLQSLATGVPVTLCLANMDKIERALSSTERTLRGHLASWRGDLSLEDLFSGKEDERCRRQSLILGGIYPSNSSGVYQLLPPGLALGPVLLKPGSGDIFTPIRLRKACEEVGFPVEAFGIYPGDGEQLSKSIQRTTNRRLIFGGAETVAKYENDIQVEIHGPGCSKIVFGPDMEDSWERDIDTVVESIIDGSGRGCISCSAVYAPGTFAERLAIAISDRIGNVEVKPLDDPDAMLAAFGSQKGAEGNLDLMTKFVEFGNGKFITPTSDRAVTVGEYSVLRPVVAYIPNVRPGAFSASKFEIPAPAVLVVNSDGHDPAKIIGSTLVCTVITKDSSFLEHMADSARISRLNREAIPTFRINSGQKLPVPLEGVGMPRFMYDPQFGADKPTY